MSVVLDRGIPELKELARGGVPSVRCAKTIAEQPPSTQRKILRSSRRRSRGGNLASILRVETDKVRQRERLRLISKTNRKLEPGKTVYDVILADPPWQFDHRITGNNRAVEKHYPTMPISEIQALPINKLAGKNSILFLWTTDHHLREAEQLVAGWEFRLKARMVWVKNSFGLGRFVRNMHEYLIVATRGDFPPPPSDCVPPSVIKFQKRGHSVKPALYDLIQKMTPGMTRRIELFARKRVPGWTAWGNQVPSA
jgi:N6-adenosine-specific RNA methylase IME4